MFTARRLLQLACGVIIGLGVALWIWNDRASAPGAAPGSLRFAAMAMVALGVIGGIVLFVRRGRYTAPTFRETDDITALSDERRRELMRGTSLFLREMKYRYSVRLDAGGVGDRRCFAAEVNGIRLGFIPAVVTDNSNDRQGYGFVAFVHDGKRWRGPGLPCPADQAEAVQHAARCVSPLATEDETHFEDTWDSPM